MSITADTTGASTAGYTDAETSVGRRDRTGMLLHHVNYFAEDPSEIFTASGEDLRFGLSYTHNFPETEGFLPDSDGVIDWHLIEREDHGTAASAILTKGLLARADFFNEPGGGRLVHPASLVFWWGTQSGSLGLAACHLHAELWYTYTDVDEDWYREYLEQRLDLSTV